MAQKLRPPCAIRVPRATKTAQAGSTSEMNASDSPNASAATIGAGPHFMGPHEFNDVLGDAVDLIFGRHRPTGDKERPRLVPSLEAARIFEAPAFPPDRPDTHSINTIILNRGMVTCSRTGPVSSLGAGTTLFGATRAAHHRCCSLLRL